MTAAAAEDRERVGPYRVIRAIGAGGSARIDLARIDRAYGFQRHVVIKRPLEHLRGNPEVAASLRREARIGGQLRHPNLVAILDAGVHDSYDYLVLEYVHGAALRTVMQTESPGRVREIPLAVALAIIAEVARGMHEAHELTDERGSPLGLVHRDVSPGNILLGLDGSVKLADFGIAKETRVSTLSGSILGTVTYMAPEQCQGHAFDRRADVFSLGVILYELVTGIRLFWADNDVASLHRVLSGSVPRPRKIKPQVPSALEDILLTAVAHEADKRYPTALELAIALELHAARAGEVLGARWIARMVDDVVGPKQEPWIATTPAPPPPVREASRGDGSLVELIAAAGPDEPIDAAFGDAADDAASLEERRPVVAPAGWSRRARMAIAGVIALGVVCGTAVAALVIAQGSDPASPAKSKAAAPTSPPPAPPSVATESPAPRTATPDPAPPPPPPDVVPAATPNPAPPPTDIAPATVARKRRRATPPPPPAKAAPIAAEAKASVPEARPSEPVAPAPPALPAPGSAAPPPPAAKPPPSVQWKPTMLLPTDGSAARPPT